jgi:GH25 family lysozyme M1 (1,4-beta-N-acetylmuramidase)
MTTYLGIGDASDNDTFSTTSWDVAKANGCRFGIVRASTTGAWVNGKPGLKEDAMFDTNVVKMKAAGLTIYPYIWFDPRLPGEAQANFFLSVLRESDVNPSGTKYAILDVEKSGTINYNATALAQLKIAGQIIKDAGWNAAIYTYPTGVDELAVMGADITWMGKYPLMIAHWNVDAPRCPWPWYPRSEVLWQYTASMPGKRYGFNAKPGALYAPKICMAVTC